MTSRKAKESKSADSDFQFTNAIPIQVWRSDGTEMPAEYSQYERVEEGSKPIIEWQNKLGQALAAEVLPEGTGLYFLQDFPTHYHLRWYQAKDEKKKSQAKHYYLFGYPEEPGASKARKYYRSPNQFLPHLLWLIGESQNRGDCACEFCSGSKPITSKAAKTKLALPPGQGAPSTATSTLAPAAASNNNVNPNVNSVASTTKNTTTAPSTTQRPTNILPTAAQQSLSHETPTPAPFQVSNAAPSESPYPYPIAHDHDALFRAGEIVWFKNNNSWRVGMTITSNPSLSIIPLTHPLYRTQAVIKEEADIRPFLAFSIPQINLALQEFKGRALAQIDWQTLQERFGANTDPSRREGLAIEATKLAATRVDQSYSTFNAVQVSGPDHDDFGGVFLGAEKICVGEAVRIKLSREQQEQSQEKGMPWVLVIKRILIRKEGGTLMFEGSLWTLQHLFSNEQIFSDEQHQTPGPVQLPTALLGEKEFRNGILRNSGWSVKWVLMNQNITVNESAIRGRFYETRRLTPILNPAKFQEMIQTQRVTDIQTLLNNRGDSSGPYVGRVLNRAQAVAGAVPPGVSAQLGPDVIEA
ncbi:hypothetical protein F5Y01DRAFT_125925 [Xylaria sp. FL0043]|nr:hypothetical protein F5Y01DRAFT_125925 [Xylaria sp. FL0043]